jgi:hypothetical protein
MENELQLDESVKTKIMEHMRQLSTTFRAYLPAMSSAVIPSMTLPPLYLTLRTEEKEQSREISTEYKLRNSFESTALISFWLGLEESS